MYFAWQENGLKFLDVPLSLLVSENDYMVKKKKKRCEFVMQPLGVNQSSQNVILLCSDVFIIYLI